MADLSRRGFFFGLGASVIAAPAIVRAASLMPIQALEEKIGLDNVLDGYLPVSGELHAELQAVVRRAFIPRIYTQIFNSSPLLSALMEQAAHA